MNVASIEQPEVYWISGSPPAWRVLLGLALKRIPYASRQLDASKDQHKSADYLLLNPRGQVPTLSFEGAIIRESIAILAFLDARWPARPIFGSAPARIGADRQSVMEAETALHIPLRTTGQILFRGEAKQRKNELISAAAATRRELERWERTLEVNEFAVDDEPSAADCVLYPSVAWLRRAIDKSARQLELPTGVATLLEDHPQVAFWCHRVQALHGFETTYPPHWRETPTAA
jgi:glutathione S-transferase